MTPPTPVLVRPLPATTPRRPSVPVRTLAAGAVAWSVTFAAVNLWVQGAAVIGTDHALSDHLLGLAVLNAVAIVLKLVGVAIVVAAMRPWGERHAGPITALLTGAVVALALWGVAAFVALRASGPVTAAQSFADGLLTIPGWTYPTFFVIGAIAFAGPARHIARLAPTPRRWGLAGALLVPVGVLATIAATAQLLISTGLLP